MRGRGAAAAAVFPLLLLVNAGMYIESGVVPCLLLQLTSAFHMRPGQQGLLGGVVYLSLSLGSPLAGWALRHFEQQRVIAYSILANLALTLLWSLTPVNQPYSTQLFIALRSLMGLSQSFFCVYIPLWTNEFAPREKRTKWMSYMQATVPLGIICGYVLSSLVLSFSSPLRPMMCGHLLCWRWPLIIEVLLLIPLAFIFLCLPKESINVSIQHRPATETMKDGANSVPSLKRFDSLEGTDIDSSLISSPSHQLYERTSTDIISVLEDESQNVGSALGRSLTASLYSPLSGEALRGERDSLAKPDSRDSFLTLLLGLGMSRKLSGEFASRKREASECSMDLEESIDARYEMDPLNINTTAPSSLLTSFSGQGTQSNHLPFNRSPRNGYAASSETCQIIDSVSVPHLKYESFKDIQIKNSKFRRPSTSLQDSLLLSPTSPTLINDTSKTLFRGDDADLSGDSGSEDEAIAPPPAPAAPDFEADTFRSAMQSLLRNHLYRNLLLALSSLYFVVTGVQYWGASYLTISLGVSPLTVNALFIFCAATAPTSGVFFGGWFVDMYVGGYRGKTQRTSTLEISCVFGFMACICAVPITLVENIFEAVFFMWLVLFFGGAILPSCSGILVSIVPRRLRPLASALCIVVINLFGYFLSLVLTGLLMDVLDDPRLKCSAVCSRTWGFRLILFWSFVALSFLCAALYSSYSPSKSTRL